MERTRTPRDAEPRPPFVLERIDASPAMEAAMRAYPPDTTARVEWRHDLVVVTHREFSAELDPIRGRGRFARTMRSSAPLEITLKVAMSCALPLAFGVPLHGASVVLGDSASIFFGPSGAGKSTIASLAEGAVLSDELVAVREEQGVFGVRATGFWGTLNRETAPLERFPVGGVFELKKEPKLRIEKLSPRLTMRKLLGVVLVPTAPMLWSRVVAVLDRLVASVPGYELGWAKESSPWNEVRAASERSRARPGERHGE